MLKNMIFLSLFFLFALPVEAQEKADSVYEFRFMSESDMFYIPYRNNQTEFNHLSFFVEKHKEAILGGQIPVYIDGYANTAHDKAKNLSIARKRSNRVKSELILHSGLTEACFITHNHSEKGELVIVRIRIPATHDTEESPVQTKTEVRTPQTETAKKTTEATTGPSQKEQQASAATSVTLKAPPEHNYPFALRANLLRWATLTPDLGVEWRINRHWGILVNGTWTSWSWNNRNRRYALWNISPVIHYYMGKEKRGYMGVMYHAGEFNCKFSGMGRQGDYQGGGMVGGYSLPIGKRLALDFSLGMGYTRADYEKYTVTEGIRVRQGNKVKNYWGINQAGITLVWKLL